MKFPNSLTDDELKAYAVEHLRYEVGMLTHSAGVLVFLAKHRDAGYLPQVLHNALLNTFSMHARNLVAFLYARSMKKDFNSDLVIEDYVNVSLVEKHLAPVTPLLESVLTKSNKQVAHLTKERIEYQTMGKEWDFIEIVEEIRGSLASIVSHIPSARMSDELKRELSCRDVVVPLIDISLKNPGNPLGVGICLSPRVVTTHAAQSDSIK